MTKGLTKLRLPELSRRILEGQTSTEEPPGAGTSDAGRARPQSSGWLPPPAATRSVGEVAISSKGSTRFDGHLQVPREENTPASAILAVVWGSGSGEVVGMWRSVSRQRSGVTPPSHPFRECGPVADIEKLAP